MAYILYGVVLVMIVLLAGSDWLRIDGCLEYVLMLAVVGATTLCVVVGPIVALVGSRATELTWWAWMKPWALVVPPVFASWPTGYYLAIAASARTLPRPWQWAGWRRLRRTVWLASSASSGCAGG